MVVFVMSPLSFCLDLQKEYILTIGGIFLICEFCFLRPTMLDNFALLSGQISSLNRLMKNEKMPIFRNYVMLPLALSPERDPELEVSIFLFYTFVPCFFNLRQHCEPTESIHE